MTKSVSTSKTPRKQHSPECRHEVLKLSERIGVAAENARWLEPHEAQRLISECPEPLRSTVAFSLATGQTQV